MRAHGVSDTYVVGDWGTSRLRLFRYAEGVEQARIDGPGIAKLYAPASAVLLRLLEPWRNAGPIADITLSGMAGARGGLIEVGYLECPAAVGDWRQHATAFSIDGVPVRVMSGLRCRDADGQPDVMRGEEAQIFGALALDPVLSTGAKIFVLPGTHCKWVSVQDGVIQGFRTYPTGEVFGLLADHSTLVPRSTSEPSPSEGGFLHGLDRSHGNIFRALFEARAAQLVDGRSGDWARSFLSGLLIGGEVAAEAPSGSHVVLVGDPALCARYETALTKAGCTTHFLDGDAAALAGLELARGGAA